MLRRLHTAFTTALLLVSALSPIFAETTAEQGTSPEGLPPKEKLHVYLLMGQSNMAGRGKVETGAQPEDRRVLVFTQDQKWAVAKDPLHWDKPKVAGVGPGLSFAKSMADAQKGITIGLVPCAVGGTPLRRWERSGDLYTAALERTRAAMATGTLSGVLWHQGESDSNEKLAATYQERLTRMFQDLRTDLGAPSLPIVVGELGRFHIERTGKPAQMVNDALHNVTQSVPAVAIASSDGLKDGGDKLHFDADSQREFGRRYAAAMLKLLSTNHGAQR
ncbi:sialate O-acetylesterase [Verrucomicrobiota bacterium sgz303538]